MPEMGTSGLMSGEGKTTKRLDSGERNQVFLNFRKDIACRRRMK